MAVSAEGPKQEIRCHGESATENEGAVRYVTSITSLVERGRLSGMSPSFYRLLASNLNFIETGKTVTRPDEGRFSLSYNTVFL